MHGTLKGLLDKYELKREEDPTGIKRASQAKQKCNDRTWRDHLIIFSKISQVIVFDLVFVAFQIRFIKLCFFITIRFPLFEVRARNRKSWFWLIIFHSLLPSEEKWKEQKWREKRRTKVSIISCSIDCTSATIWNNNSFCRLTSTSKRNGWLNF